MIQTKKTDLLFEGMKLHRYMHRYDIKIVTMSSRLTYKQSKSLLLDELGSWEIPTVNFLSQMYVQIDSASRAVEERKVGRQKYYSLCEDLVSFVRKKSFWTNESRDINYQYCVKMDSECNKTFTHLQPTISENHLLIIKKTDNA